MAERRSLAKLPPLLFGRVARVLFGAGVLYWTAAEGMEELGLTGYTVLILLGLSFLIGGAVGNPGCEVTALPNLFLPKDNQIHFV